MNSTFESITEGTTGVKLNIVFKIIKTISSCGQEQGKTSDFIAFHMRVSFFLMSLKNKIYIWERQNLYKEDN